jgi:tRNA-2-methylthio-N6-dimethylallyladenosine synthase
LVGRDVEVLCEGRSKTNAARLTGRTRTNKIVVFAPTLGNGVAGPASPRPRRADEGDDDIIGELVDIRIERANGFSLYGTPVLATSRASSGDRS